MSHIDDAELCALSPDTWLVTGTPGLCGGGITQPSSPRCPNHAAWGIYGYQHGYCTTHAAKHLRAKGNLARMQADAEVRRAKQSGASL